MKRLIEIKALENGSHRNQTATDITPTPRGWAVIPDDMETPNFPFGDIEVEDANIMGLVGVDGEEVEKVIGTEKRVTKWIPGVVPEAEPTPDPEPTTEELLNIILGVDE